MKKYRDYAIIIIKYDIIYTNDFSEFCTSPTIPIGSKMKVRSFSKNYIKKMKIGFKLIFF